MGSRAYEQQPNLNFSGDPRRIEGALCMGEEGSDVQDLTENDDGTYVNDHGDIFERDGDVFKLKTEAESSEFLRIKDEVKRLNPSFNDDLAQIEARTRYFKGLRIRIAAEKAAAAEAAKKAEKAAKKEANRQNKKRAKK